MVVFNSFSYRIVTKKLFLNKKEPSNLRLLLFKLIQRITLKTLLGLLHWMWQPFSCILHNMKNRNFLFLHTEAKSSHRTEGQYLNFMAEEPLSFWVLLLSANSAQIQRRLFYHNNWDRNFVFIHFFTSQHSDKYWNTHITEQLWFLVFLSSTHWHFLISRYKIQNYRNLLLIIQTLSKQFDPIIKLLGFTSVLYNSASCLSPMTIRKKGCDSNHSYQFG